MPTEPTHITVHHTATASGPGAEVVEQIRHYHVDERGWEDIAYHLLIDDEGAIWPGRPFSVAPDTHSDYDFTGHIAVAVLGNFEEGRPSDAALRTLRAVITVLRMAFPSAHVGGHGDYAETACPGRYLREALYAGNQTSSHGSRFWS